MNIIFPLLLLCATAIEGITYNLKINFNASGDGVTNDRHAFGLALSTLKANDSLQIPAGTYRLILTSSFLSVPSGAIISGEGSSSILSLERDDNTKYTEFVRPGSNSLLTNLVIKRNSDFPAVLMPLIGSGISFRGVTVIGNKDLYPTQYCHCLMVGGGALTNTLIDASTFHTCEFALLQVSTSKGTVDGFLVRNSIFSNNYASDLEFNAPNSVMRNISVINTVFSNNQSPGPSAGWAVGLANVQTALIQNNTITNYLTCGIHVEDRSSNIRIDNNRIINAAQINDNEIFIVSNSTFVTITNNVIDSRNNTRNHYVILATAGGSSFQIPTNVVVSGNVLYAGNLSRMWYLQPGTGPTPTMNRLQWEAELSPKTSSVAISQYYDSNASNRAANLINTAALGDQVTYTLKGVPPGNYTVVVGVQLAKSFGQFQLQVNGVSQGVVQDLYGNGGFVALILGDRMIPLVGDVTLNFNVTGKNPMSSSYTLALDYFQLAPAGTTRVSTTSTTTTTTATTSSATATTTTTSVPSATSSTTSSTTNKQSSITAG